MQEHGQAQCHAFGQVLWITVEGSVNQLFSESYRDRVIAAALPLAGKPWVRVTDIRHWQLGGPEIMPALNELMQWCETHEMAHSINIVSLKNLQVHLLDKMMAGVSRHSQRHVLQSPKQAIAQLATLGYPLEPSQVMTALYPGLPNLD
ncbi:hypothetical protein [Corallincola spongiicola]|uniref:STAS domain-containing protein n=1 Tax=Corallincola spongiicola TaxID=2520508 RepID=A0ABY1WRR2_9GAMM|nr:hypothetical protein [Corallincola spongiicola]TAA47315.1 hypothetical protein EXY25_08770 [Corallincola spongiicola]